MPAGGNSFEALNLAPILAALHTVTSNADEGFRSGEEHKLRRAQTVGKNNHPLLVRLAIRLYFIFFSSFSPFLCFVASCADMHGV